MSYQKNSQVKNFVNLICKWRTEIYMCMLLLISYRYCTNTSLINKLIRTEEIDIYISFFSSP